MRLWHSADWVGESKSSCSSSASTCSSSSLCGRPAAADAGLVPTAARASDATRLMARDAQENGAVHAAVMDVLVDGVALSASLTVVLGDAPVDQDGNPAVDPAALSQLLLATELTEALTAALRPTAAPEGGSGPNGAPAPDGPAPGGAEGEQTAEGDEPAEMVALPAGPAVRVRRITGSGVAGSTRATAETQYFVAVPGTAKMLVLTFATPNVDYRWHFEELFDRI